jgi:hypothetical protein
MDPATPIEEEIIRWMEVPRHPNVFALGTFARQVTFASQQTRALNLIWALFRTARLSAGQRIAVVGAGLGGLTAAVAALTKGCAVDLYDQASQPCPVQRGNDTRFIHPNILRWPDQDAKAAQTEFPFLNWTAASARGVIRQIELQWIPFTANQQLGRFFNYRVDRLGASASDSDSARPSIAANRVVDGKAAGDETPDGTTPGYKQVSYDCVILAIGFGDERSVAGVSLQSYWESDSLHQETGRKRRSILVSGCGDGGLIDALRLRLRNFDHADFTRQFLDWQAGARVPRMISRLRRIDADLRPFALAPDISLRFHAAYDALRVPKKVERYFRERSRSDTRVTLSSPGTGPLTFRSSLLNRYATYLAMRYAELRYLSGRIVARRADSAAYDVTLQREDGGLQETHIFDLVIVRHGPESVIEHLIPASDVSPLRKLWSENEDITTRSWWRGDDQGTSHRFFRDAETREPLGNDVLIDLARTTFDSASREFLADDSIQAVAVGKDEGHAGFIVTLKPGSPPRSPGVRGNVPVRYVVAPSSPSSRTAAPPGAGARRTREERVPVGIGVYNYSADRRLLKRHGTGADRATATEPISPTDGTERILAGVGTLGCFATDRTGRRYLITSGDAIARGARVGDTLYLEGQHPTTGHKPVATLSRIYVIPRAGTKTTTRATASLSIVAARLTTAAVPDFDPIPFPWSISRVGTAKLEEAAKVGRTSGWTVGDVSAIEVDHIGIMMSDARKIILDGCIEITGKDGTDFSRPGDSGAVVIQRNGSAIGIVIAGSLGSSTSPGVTIAFPLRDALSGLGLRLLSSKSMRRSRSSR